MKLNESAFCKVFGVTEDQLNIERCQQILNNALLDVGYREEPYEGESERDAARRLAMDGPANGEVHELAQYFKELYPNDFKDATTWEVIFEIYKRMNGISELLDLSDTQNNNNFISGGISTMNTNGNATLQDLERLEQEELGTDVQGSVAPTAETNAETQKAANDMINDQIQERIKKSKTAVVTNIVLAKPDAEKILVEGQSAKGVVSNPQAAFDKFCEVLDVHESEGEVVFNNVAPGQYDAAMTMYNELKAAIADPSKEFDVNVSKATPSIKGYRYAESSNATGEFVKANKMLNILMTETAGGVYFPDKSMQLRYRKAAKKKNGGKKGAGTASNDNAFSGIVSTAIVGKAEAIAQFGVYHKEITTTVKEKTGFKSVLKVKFIKDRNAADNTVKYGTYRIPLKANAYELQVVNKDLEQVFGDGSTGIKTVAPVDFTAIEAITSDLSQILAAAASVTSQTEGMLAEIRTSAAAKQAEATAAQQEDVGVNM